MSEDLLHFFDARRFVISQKEWFDALERSKLDFVLALGCPPQMANQGLPPLTQQLTDGLGLFCAFILQRNYYPHKNRISFVVYR